jgi:hypothetical protein
MGAERYVQQDSVVTEDLDDDLCLYLDATNDVAVLNQTAADIWTLVDGARSNTEIVAMLARAYGRPAEEISDDVQRVLGDLAGRGFLVPAVAQ